MKQHLSIFFLASNIMRNMKRQIESGRPNKNNCCQLEIQEIPKDVDLEKLPVTFDALHYDEAGFVSQANRLNNRQRIWPA